MSRYGRRLRYPPRINVPPSPVTVRSIFTPKPGWKLEAAVELVRQGYTPAHAQEVTGWAASVIEAELKERSDTQ